MASAPAAADVDTRNRLAVFLNRSWAWVTYGRGARLIPDIAAVRRTLTRH